MTTNAFYGKFIKTFTDQFTNEMNMFLVLKNKDYQLESKFFGDDGKQFHTIKCKLFGNTELEKDTVYLVKVLEMSEYLGHEYVKTLTWMEVPARKSARLLAKFDVEVEPVATQMEMSDDDESFVDKRERKQTRKKRKMVVSDSDGDL